MTTKRLDLKQFNVFGHSLPLLLDENTGKELVKSARKREDDIFKIDGKQRFHGAFTGGFSAGHWNTVGSEAGWAPQEFKSSRKEKFASKRQRPQVAILFCFWRKIKKKSKIQKNIVSKR